MGQITHPNLGSPMAMVTPYAELVVTGSVYNKGFTDSKTGANKNLQWNAEAPQICSQDYLMALAEGDIAGHTPFSKYGIVGSVQTAEKDVWPVNQRYIFPTIGSNMRFVSSHAQDTSGNGIGARCIRVHYLDSNYVDHDEDVCLSGTTVVTSVGSDIFRINQMQVYYAGASGTTIGSVIAYHFSGTQIYGMIDSGFSQTRQCIYTVPSGQTLYLTSVRYSSGQGAVTNKQNYTIFRNRANYFSGISGGGVIFYPYNEIGLLNNAYTLPLEMPTKLLQKTDLKISVQGDTTQDVTCTAALRGWIE